MHVRQTRRLVLLLVAMPLAAGCGKGPDAAAADTVADVQGSDVVDVATHDTPPPADSAPIDTGATGPCNNAAAPAGSNLHVRIQGDDAFKGSYLRLDVVNADGGGLSVFRVAAVATLYDGKLTGPPMDWYGVAPPGTWMLRAIVTLKPGDMETSIGGGVACGPQGMAEVTVSAGACPSATVPLATDDRVENAGDLCGGSGAGGKGLFKPLSTVVTPPTQAGGAHLMNGVLTGERLWVAASQDGVVSFDFPANPPQPAAKLNNWQVHGQAPCNRLHRAGTTVFCTSRQTHVAAITTDATTGEPTKKAAITLPPGSHGEGMTDRAGRLYVANHTAGLVGVDLKELTSVTALKPPAVALDAWDVAVQGTDRLLLANGAQGLLVLAGDTKSDVLPPVVGQLSLAGVAAFLAVQGEQVAIGALNGGLHVARLQANGQPMLQGSFAPRGLVHGVTFHGDLVLGAAGSHLLAVERPKTEQPGTALAPLGLQPSFYFAMDIESFGDGALSSEFQGIRHLAIDPTVDKGPLLDAPLHVMAPLTAVGKAIEGDLRLHNRGVAPLHIKQVLFSETPELGGLPTVLAKNIELAPGAFKTLPISVLKTTKGGVKHELVVISDDPAWPSWPVGLFEVPELRPGDKLPALAYKDATGQLVDVNQHLSGKVGVVIVAAHACPVSFLALAAAMDDLGSFGNKIAVVGIDPWDSPSTAPETEALPKKFKMLFSPLSTSDGHDNSEVLDQYLGQPILAGPPMPILYVVAPGGTITWAQWGYESDGLLAAIGAALGTGG